MATKQPPFPNPALEWGIPQYPTPNVPDFYTKDGHILLVEKVSAEKGSYNPQPLDGSVTYSKRDANKWPTDLYLVYQKPDETGQFVYNYYANDRTLASQDAWNFGLDYSSNNPAFPVTSRTYIVPRDQYETVALGSTDPVFGGNQIIAAQKKVELPEDNPLRSRYVGVQRVYETIPGPEIEGKTIGEFGYISTKKQVVRANASLPTPTASTVKLDISPIDSVKSEFAEADYDSLSTLTGYQYDADLNLIVTNTKQIISAGSAAPSITNGLLASRDEALDVWKTVRIQSRISSLPSARTEYKTGAYASPNLLYGFNSSVFNFPDGQIQYNVTPVMRAKRSYQTVFKHETSFQYGQPSAPSDTLFDPISIHVIYDGFFFKIDIPDCLTDPGLQLWFNTGINTPAAAYYGVINEYYIVPTSTTTATSGAGNYLSKVGTYQLIAYEVDYWKANIWRISKQSVLIK
jgi:hypothetical protein